MYVTMLFCYIFALTIHRLNHMKDVRIRYVFDRRGIATQDRRGTLHIEVRPVGRTWGVMLPTGIKLLKTQVSHDQGFTCINHEDANRITSAARKTFKDIEAYVLYECETWAEVRNWNCRNTNTRSFIEFIYSELSRNDPSHAVIAYHTALLRRLNEFGKITTFASLTHANIIGFDAHLRKTIKSQPTLYARHLTLHRYIREAINRGLCNFDPYLKIKLIRGKAKDPIFLNEREIDAIRNFTTDNKTLGRVRDIFLFQIYTGLAYVDLTRFDKSYIAELDGYHVIQSNRKKTNESFISIFLPEAREIAEKYDYRLPVPSNQQYNAGLKLIAAKTGIRKHITTHTARHTYATFLLNRGIPLETVSRAMGHSNIKMTTHYARLLGHKVVADMAVLLK